MNLHKSKIFKRIFLGVFLLVVFFLSFKSLALATFVQDTQGTESSPQSFWLKFSQSVNSSGTDVISWTGWPMQSILSHMIAIIGGYPDETGNIPMSSISKSLIGGLSSSIGLVYQAPISSTEYLAYTINRLNPIKSVYAQGQGGIFFQPILTVWTITRNIAYLFFVIIFVAIGFMIMLRKKIDPQTVISIQSALPKIVVALILVTFSYAISGLIVDLAFLFIEIIKSVFFAPGSNITAILQARNLPTIDSVNPQEIVKTFWGALSNNTLSLLGLGIQGIFGLVILTSSFKLFFGLLTKYVTLVLSCIASPFIFLWGIIPGQGELSSWFKSMISAAISFPATYLVLNLALYFMTLPVGTVGTPQYIPAFTNIPPLDLSINIAGPTPTPFIPPGVHPLNPALPAPAPLSPASKVVAVGVFLLATRIPELVDSLMKTERPALAGGLPELQGALRRIPILGGLIGG